MATKGSQFIVSFGNVKLPAATEKRIAASIQNTVISEIAKLDFRGDLRVRFPRKEWLGIWIDRIPTTKIPVVRGVIR